MIRVISGSQAQTHSPKPNLKGCLLSTNHVEVPQQINKVTKRLLPVFCASLPDLLDILDEMMCKNAVEDRKYGRLDGVRSVKFNGWAIVRFLLREGFSENPDGAIILSQKMVRIGGLLPVFHVQNNKDLFSPAASAWYVHRGRTEALRTGQLNMMQSPLPASMTLSAVLRALSELSKVVRGKFFSENGRFARIGLVRGSSEWRKVLTVVAVLANCDDDRLEGVRDQTRTAWFVNLFNILMLHRRLVHGPVESIRGRANLFHSTAYKLAGSRVAAHDIIHGLLRGQMPDHDVRSAWKVKNVDSRVLLALHWGFHSSPSYFHLNPNSFKENVNRLSNEFVNESMFVDKSRQIVTLPRIFKWFQSDFSGIPTKHNRFALMFGIARMAKNQDRNDLEVAIREAYKLDFEKFDWADYACNDSTSQTFPAFLYDFLYSC